MKISSNMQWGIILGFGIGWALITVGSVGALLLYIILR